MIQDIARIKAVSDTNYPIYIIYNIGHFLPIALQTPPKDQYCGKSSIKIFVQDFEPKYTCSCKILNNYIYARARYCTDNGNVML